MAQRPPRKPPPRRRPPARQGAGRRVPAGVGKRTATGAKPPQKFDPRKLGIGAAVALAVIVLTVILLGGGDDSQTSSVEPPQPTATLGPRMTPTPSPTPEPKSKRKPKPEPDKRSLTVGQRKARAAAIKVVDKKGYRVERPSDYQPGRLLQVLIGSRGSSEHAFFFVDGEYIGTDASEASRGIAVRPGGDEKSVVLRYQLQGNDSTDVKFTWDGTRLVPAPGIPSLDERT